MSAIIGKTISNKVFFLMRNINRYNELLPDLVQAEILTSFFSIPYQLLH